MSQICDNYLDSSITIYIACYHISKLSETRLLSWTAVRCIYENNGLTRYATKGHLALDELRTDGGMVENELLMQFQADILNKTVVRPSIKETTALGAAYAAGLGIGLFKNADELCSFGSSIKLGLR